jgi:hypothetical protein
MPIGREAVVAAGSAGRGGEPLPRPETSERNDTCVITPVCSPHVKPLRVIWPVNLPRTPGTARSGDGVRTRVAPTGGLVTVSNCFLTAATKACKLRTVLSAASSTLER